MALSFTRIASLYSTTNATSYAAGSVTPGADKLLVAFVAVSATSPAEPPTVSGHGLTWTKLTLTDNTLSTTHVLAVYVAKSGSSPTSGAFTVSGYGGNQTGAVLIEFEVDGADLSGTAAQAIVQNPTNNGNTGTAASVTLSAAGHALNRGMGFLVHLANSAPSGEGGNWVTDANASGNYNTPATGAVGQHNATAYDTSVGFTVSNNIAWRAVALEIKADLTQAVTGAFRAAAATLFAGVITVGAVTVGGAHLSSGASLFAGDVTQSGGGAQAGYRSHAAFWLGGASAPSSTQSIGGAHLASGAQLFAGTVTTGAVSVDGAHIASTAQLFAGTVSPGAVSVDGAHLSSGAQLFPGTITVGAVSVAGATIASGHQLFPGTVTPGAVSVDGAHLASTAQVFAGAITAGDTNVDGAHVASTAQLFAGTVTVGAVNVSGAHLASGAALFAGTVTPGAVTVDGATIASGHQLFPGAITAPDQNLVGAHLASGASLFPGTATVGAVTVDGAHLASGAQLFPGAVTVGAVSVGGAHIASTAQLFAGTVGIAQDVSGATLASTAQLFAGAVTQGNPVVLTITGSYDPTIRVSGDYAPTIRVSGDYAPLIQVTGDFDMAPEASLDGLFVGADHAIEYTDTDEDMTGWTVVLDIRASDTATASKLSKTGVVSGTYQATPASNTQKVTFTLTDDDLSATVFSGNEWQGRYSIKRTDAGSEQPLRFGDVTITRVTQV